MARIAIVIRNALLLGTAFIAVTMISLVFLTKILPEIVVMLFLFYIAMFSANLFVRRTRNESTTAIQLDSSLRQDLIESAFWSFLYWFLLILLGGAKLLWDHFSH